MCSSVIEAVSAQDHRLKVNLLDKEVVFFKLCPFFAV